MSYARAHRPLRIELPISDAAAKDRLRAALRLEPSKWVSSPASAGRKGFYGHVRGSNVKVVYRAFEMYSFAWIPVFRGSILKGQSQGATSGSRLEGSIRSRMPQTVKFDFVFGIMGALLLVEAVANAWRFPVGSAAGLFLCGSLLAAFPLIGVFRSKNSREVIDADEAVMRAWIGKALLSAPNAAER